MKLADETVATALSRAAGVELDAYREEHVAERVRRALGREGVADIDELVPLVRSDREARARFRRSIAVSVSGLFRDPAQFELLERELLPRLLGDGRRLRVWSAGCADGSELYTVGMILERLGALERAFLLGSDLLEENLEAAKRGVYGDVPVARELRLRARWERRDLVREDAPGGKWSLVLCRNVTIYLAPEAKLALHDKLAASLADDGFLVVGRSERVSGCAALGLARVGPHAYRRLR